MILILIQCIKHYRKLYTENKMIGILYSPIFIFIISACWGSFLHLCIIRIPKGESIVTPRSYCRTCKKKLYIYQNLPLLSWIFLKGKCQFCKKKIKSRYFITELFVAFIFTFLFFSYSLQWILLPYFIFCSLLIIGSGIDIDEHWIPDTITLGSILLGLIFSFIMPDLHREETNIAGLKESIIGLIVGLGILIMIGIAGKLILKRDSMGMGDVKLLGAIGSFLGWEAVIFIIFFASLLGLLSTCYLILTRKQSLKDEIPFGPYLTAASLFCILTNIQPLKIFTDYYFS